MTLISPALVEKYYRIILSEIRRQDRSAALSYLYSENVENAFPVFKLITDDYKEAAEALGGMPALASTISNIAGRFTTIEEKQALEDFNTAHKSDFGDSSVILEKAVKNVETNLKWAEERLPSVLEYFANKINSV